MDLHCPKGTSSRRFHEQSTTERPRARISSRSSQDTGARPTGVRQTPGWPAPNRNSLQEMKVKNSGRRLPAQARHGARSAQAGRPASSPSLDEPLAREARARAPVAITLPQVPHGQLDAGDELAPIGLGGGRRPRAWLSFRPHASLGSWHSRPRPSATNAQCTARDQCFGKHARRHGCKRRKSKGGA